MEKFKKYNEILCEQFHEEMKKFEEHPSYERLKIVKDLAEIWADLQCIEAGEAMRKIAKREYGYGEDMSEWDEEAIYAVYDAARGGRGGRRSRDSRGRYTSNRGGRGGYYNAGDEIYNAYDDEREEMYNGMNNQMYPPMYAEMYNRQGGGRSGRSGRGRSRGGNTSSGRTSSNGQGGSYNAYDPNEMYMLRQQDGMPIWTPYAKHEQGDVPKKLTKEQIKKWVGEMENEDGTTGEHWNEQQVEQVAQKLGIKYEDFSKESFWAAMSMMYSDYCATLEHYGLNKPEVYACLAKDFLEDEDFDGNGDEKLSIYYHCIVEK